MEDSYQPQGMSGDAIPLALGLPAVEALPHNVLKEAAAHALSLPQAHLALQYGAEAGAPELIDYLVKWVNRGAGMNISAKNVMITTGSTGAVDMITRLFAHRTGVVLVEAPTYRDVLQVFRDQHLHLISISMDESGPLIEPLRALLEEVQRAGTPPAIFYTIPNFHNPTGVTTTLERRLAIIQLCQQFGVLIVEDDVYRDLAFDGRTPPGYYALAGGRGVVSVGSFSKTLAPGLRLGWMVGAEDVIEKCVNSGVPLMGGGANPLVAGIVAHYCQQGVWDVHINYLRELYRGRRDRLLAALDAHMPASVNWTRPGGGFFVWLTLPQAVNGATLGAQAKAAGVLIAPGNAFFADDDPQTRFIRLSFSYASPEAIASGVERLAGVVKGL